MNYPILMKKLFIPLALSVAALMPLTAAAQHNDPNLRRQINAVVGADKWEFSPEFPYWLLHQNYTGATMHGIFPFASFSFDEEKASVKRLWKPMLLQEYPMQVQRKQLMEDQHAKLDSMYHQQLNVSADRLNPVVIQPYKSGFEKCQDGLEEALTLALQYSGGKESAAIKSITLDNEVLVAQMEYVCTLATDPLTAMAGTMESGARQKELERIHGEMQTLCDRAVNLAKYCYLKYKH